LPDAFSKIIISRNSKDFKFKFENFLILGAVTFVCGGFLVYFSQIFIQQLLGSEWLLPVTTTVGFALLELLRGIFQISANRQISIGESSNVHKQSVRLPLIALTFATLLSFYFGLNGLILGFLFAYLIPVLVFRVRGS
jgi:hypothetical protein